MKQNILQKSSQSGFAYLFIIFLLPLLMTVIATTVFSQKIIQSYTQKQSLCRTKLLKTQQILAKHLDQILQLNPTAKNLRFQEKMILIAIAASSTNPAMVAKLLIQLNTNRTEQKILRIKMEGLLLTAQTLASSHIFMNSPEIKASSVPKLHLIKTPPTAIAPDFLPDDHFEKKQNLTATWNLKIQNLFEHWVKLPTYTGTCSATLTRKDLSWNPTLSVAKFY